MAMALEAALRAFVLADAGISSMIQDRMAYAHVPQQYTLPYIYYRYEGAAAEPGLTQSAPQRLRYALECWTESPADSIALRDAVRQRLHGYRGILADTVAVQAVFADEAGDDYIPQGAGSDDGLYGASLIVEVVR